MSQAITEASKTRLYAFIYWIWRRRHILRHVGLYWGLHREMLDDGVIDGWQRQRQGRGFLTLHAGKRRILKINIPSFDLTSKGAVQ